MKTRHAHAAILTLALTLLGACARQEEQAEAPPPSDSLTVVDSFRTPESVLYDATMDVYLVSNINGSPFDKDDNGFISRVGADGRVVELRWLDGASDSVTLNAPKGMAIRGDTLYVADIDEVRRFDRTTGGPLGTLLTRRGAFLNDIGTGPDGNLSVTDTGLRPDFSAGPGGIFRFTARGRQWDAATGGPNGVVGDTGGSYVVVYWNGDVAGFSATGRPLPRYAPGQLDGVVRLADGTLLASSWADSSIIRLAPGDTAWTRLYGSMPSPADIGLDTRRNRVLIPIFQGNRIEVRPAR